jgi:alpha-L-fucosidase
MEYYMFVHFGPNTFTGVEWGDGREHPAVFNPTDLDCRQWAATAAAAGMEGIIITAKHHDGFCLWPSAQSTHTVRESPWKDGKGDVLRELSEACREYGLQFGVYLSPWDQNHPAYGTPEYNHVFAATLTEVLSAYGEVYEQWFDGACGEGPNGKRQEYDWPLFHKTVLEHQPRAIIFSDIGPGCRWIGNESGFAGETNWSRLDTVGFGPGPLSPPLDTLNRGNVHGAAWIPGEVDVSIRPGWFYSPSTDDQVKSVAHLMDIYYKSVGRNANLLLNVPPDRRGRIHPADSARLMELRRTIDGIFAADLASGAKVTASHTRGHGKRFTAANLTDGNYDTYWTTADEVRDAIIELQLPSARTFDHLVLQEYIPLGQRVAWFSAEFYDRDAGAWHELAHGTTIGHKRILKFPAVQADRVRINIYGALACPALSTISLYMSPEPYEVIPPAETDKMPPVPAGWQVIAPKLDNPSAVQDGDPATWVSLWAGKPLVVDMGAEQTLNGFYYQPARAGGVPNVYRYNLYASADGQNWTRVLTDSRFGNILNNPVRQDVEFLNPVTARYLRFEPLEAATAGEGFAVAGFGPLVE